MDKIQLKRVQHLARRGITRQLRQTKVLAVPIDPISDQRVTQELKVDADLVRAPGVQYRFGQSRAAQSFEHAIAGLGVATGLVVDGHTLTMGRMAGNSGADFAVVSRHLTAENGVINLGYFPTGELSRERQITARPPTVLGGALVIPAGWFVQTQGEGEPALRETPPAGFGMSDKEVERLAMEAVMACERSLGFAPRDVSKENRGYDVESRYPATHEKKGQLRFIEVKGRVAGAETVTVTKNEILTALNKPDDYVLALVFVAPNGTATPQYLVKPFEQEPDFATASVTFRIKELLSRVEKPIV